MFSPGGSSHLWDWTPCSAEAPGLWPPHVKSWFIGKTDAGRIKYDEEGDDRYEMAGMGITTDGRVWSELPVEMVMDREIIQPCIHGVAASQTLLSGLNWTEPPFILLQLQERCLPLQHHWEASDTVHSQCGCTCVYACTRKHTHTCMLTHSTSSKLSVSPAICGFAVTQQAPRKDGHSKSLLLLTFKHRNHLALRNE